MEWDLGRAGGRAGGRVCRLILGMRGDVVMVWRSCNYKQDSRLHKNNTNVVEY